MSKTYKKTHANKEILNKHVKGIKNRKGTIDDIDGLTIKYHFKDSGKSKVKKMRK